MAVGAFVGTVPHTPEIIAAALLHDVFGVLPRHDGRHPGRVWPYGRRAGIGPDRRVSPGGREQGKARRFDRAHNAQTNPKAKTIKLADLIDNNRSTASTRPASPDNSGVHVPGWSKAAGQIVGRSASTSAT